MRLETERLVLRLPRLEDADAFIELYSDPVAMQFIGGVPEIDTAEAIEHWLERWDVRGFGHFAVERRDDGRVLGRTGLVVWDTSNWRIWTAPETGGHGQPELGWALARAHWGLGYATEAASAVRDWALNELGIERLISVIAPENARSQRVAAKLGCVPGESVVLADHGPAVVWEHPR
jgi:RimJ/RimL family protein N-acetyltransferase